MSTTNLPPIPDFVNLLANAEQVKTSWYSDPQGRFSALVFTPSPECSEPSNSLPQDKAQAGKPDWLSVKEAALELGISRKTVLRRIQDGTLKVWKNLRPYKITRDSLDAYRRGVSRQEQSVPQKPCEGFLPVDPDPQSVNTSPARNHRATGSPSPVNDDEFQRANEEMDSWDQGKKP